MLIPLQLRLLAFMLSMLFFISNPSHPAGVARVFIANSTFIVADTILVLLTVSVESVWFLCGSSDTMNIMNIQILLFSFSSLSGDTEI